jgi:hypothetical protein
LEEAGFDPLLEAVVGGGTGAEAGGAQGFPLAAGAQDEKDGFPTDAVGRARPTAAEAVRVLVLGQQLGDGFPQIVGEAPFRRDGMAVHDYNSA